MRTKAGGDDETVKTTVRISKPLWLDSKKRALDEGLDFQTLVERALSHYLKTRGGKQ